jgi:cation-transporting P-type ATPase 13A2
MITAVFISTYLLLDPADWLYELMELTPMSGRFKVFLLVLAAAGFVVGFLSEKWTFPKMARLIGFWKKSILRKEKKRKEYKIILENSNQRS